jgi:hypothetical protein
MGTGEVRSDGGELGEFLSAASDWHVGDVLHAERRCFRISAIVGVDEPEVALTWGSSRSSG